MIFFTTSGEPGTTLSWLIYIIPKISRQFGSWSIPLLSIPLLVPLVWVQSNPPFPQEATLSIATATDGNPLSLSPLVQDPQNKPIEQATKDLIDKLLLERLSLAGIARVTGVCELWLQRYVNAFIRLCASTSSCAS